MKNNADDMSIVLRALDFAAHRHRDHRRKGGAASPYINHLIDVADLIRNVGGVNDIITIVAAILHDAVEDTETTGEELIELFGEDVASVVMEVTDDKTLPNDVRKRLQVEHASSLSNRATLIKIADKTSNIRDIAESPPVGWSIERRRAYVMWGQEVVARIRGTNIDLERVFDDACARALEILDRENSEQSG